MCLACRTCRERDQLTRSARPVAEVPDELDQPGHRECGAERHEEGPRVVVLECLTADIAEQRGVGGPDCHGEGDPAHEPRAGLTGDARERRPRAWLKAGEPRAEVSTVR